jgi:hypothetical protein
MIDGKHLFKALETAGLVADADQVSSVTIHAEADRPVRVEIQLYAGVSVCKAFTNLSRDCE